jgi:hypothetical protein
MTKLLGCVLPAGTAQLSRGPKGLTPANRAFQQIQSRRE